MAGDPPSGYGVTPTVPPPAGNWPPPHPGQPASRPRPWLAVAVAVAVGVTAVVAVTALVVALTRRSTDSHSLGTTTTAPTHTLAEITAAQQQLCDAYKLAARAVEVDTGGQDRALARIATTNGAVMLDNAAVNPALDAKHRDAARALAAAYGALTAMGSNVVATDTQYQVALDDITAKDAVMKSVCANGGS